MTDVTTTLQIDGGNLHVRTFQDAEDIIERNKVLKNAGKQTGDFRHRGQIPNNVLLQWLNEEYARGNFNMKLFDEEFNKMVDKKLNDHDWLFLRTDR